MTSINVTVPEQDSTVKTVPHVSLLLSALIWNGVYTVIILQNCAYNVSRSFLFLLIAAEFLTRIKLLLKPTPNTVHYILTHFKGVWNIVNKISFLRNMIMRYVLTCKYTSLSSVLSCLKEKCTLQILDFKT